MSSSSRQKKRESKKWLESLNKCTLVLVPCKAGMLWGIYQDNRLVHHHCEEAKTLDALASLWASLQGRFSIENICYARGPGSLSALKLLHIFVHTLAVVRGVGVFAIDSFYFNHARPIHAFGNQFFIKESSGIKLEARPQLSIEASEVALPQELNLEHFNQEPEPLYVCPPV